MISSASIAKFKCLDDIELKDIKELTILTGPNNSGKTSLLEAIFFLRSCIINEEVDWELDDLSLNSFNEIVFNHDTNNIITISLNFDIEYEIFGSSYGEILFNTEIKNGKIIKQNVLTSEKIPIITWENQKFITHNSNFTSEKDVEVEYFAPDKEITMRNGKRGIRKAHIMKIDVPICNPFNEKNETADYISIIIKKMFTDLYYLAPNKYDTNWDCELEDDATFLGNRDENIPSMLHYKISDRDKLFDELEKWIKNFDNKITLVKAPLKSGRTCIKLDTEKTSVNLIANGTGINSVLPIIFSCIFSPKGSTILIEEPEIHLHTKAINQLMGLFLDEISNNNKQIIFTTHSWDVHRYFYDITSKKKSNPEIVEKICRFDFNDKSENIKIEPVDLDATFQIFRDELKELIG